MVETTTVSDHLRSPNFRSWSMKPSLSACFRSSSSWRNPRISPLTLQYERPQLALLIITSALETNKIRPVSSSIISCCDVQGYYACFEHSEFVIINDRERMHPRPVKAPGSSPLKERADNEPIPLGQTLSSTSRNPTTSFLTTTELIYTIGAGITAAAGTRLALQLFLVKVFKLFSFQIVYT